MCSPRDVNRVGIEWGVLYHSLLQHIKFSTSLFPSFREYSSSILIPSDPHGSCRYLSTIKKKYQNSINIFNQTFKLVFKKIIKFNYKKNKDIIVSLATKIKIIYTKFIRMMRENIIKINI
jgi:hypothetical protein